MPNKMHLKNEWWSSFVKEIPLFFGKKRPEIKLVMSKLKEERDFALLLSTVALRPSASFLGNSYSKPTNILDFYSY